jgi:uncharacterized protein (TIGR04255 family)
MKEAAGPLVGPPPDEVHLDRAPLVRVLAQIRFPEVLSVGQREFVAPFQEALKDAYPVLREEQVQGFLLSSNGFAPSKPASVWRFSDLNDDWRVSLAPTFLALETKRYLSRHDFFGRLGVVASALERFIQPKMVDRIGVRYIDRIVGPTLSELPRLIRPELVGVVSSEVASGIAHTISETLFNLESGRQMLTRWGSLPPGATVDPAALDPVDERSWILDLDVFTSGPGSFSVEGVVGEARGHAERIYSFFRWAVTDEFLRRFGGTV